MKNKIEHITPLPDEELIAIFNRDNPDQYTNIEYLTRQQIIDRFRHLLTEEEFKKLIPSDNV